MFHNTLGSFTCRTEILSLAVLVLTTSTLSQARIPLGMSRRPPKNSRRETRAHYNPYNGSDPLETAPHVQKCCCHTAAAWDSMVLRWRAP